MVEVLKTNVQELDYANAIIQILLEHFPNYKINFDLENCDKILRLEATSANAALVVKIAINNGYFCAALQ